MKANTLRRFQVLLEDWQEEYLKYICEKHDYSFSELIRFFLSVGFLNHTSLLSPKYKSGINKKRLAEMTKKISKLMCTEEERYKIMSILHFEARKAVEYRLNEVRKQKKKDKY
jgi:hypothetical protein